MPPTPAAAPPLIEYQPDGKPPVLNYNIAQRTTYAGRNYIDLGIPGAWFRPAAVPTEAAIAAPAVIRSERERRALVAADGVSAIELDEATAEALERTGLELRAYRTLSGDLAVRPIDASLAKPGEPTTPVEPADPLIVVVTIDSAPEVLEGSLPPGVTLKLAGSAYLESGAGSITKVEVAVGSAAPKLATPKNAADWSSWTLSEVLTSAGTVPITVTARHSNNKTIAQQTANVRVVLKPVATPPSDTTAPSVSIKSPAEGAFIHAPSGTASLEVAGAASDDVGVKAVTVMIDGGPPTQATPKAANDWSQWKASLSLGLGNHLISARCVDAAGNASTASVGVVVSEQPKVEPVSARLMLVESYQLASYLGSYGAGLTVKTFSLLPGERTRITLKTYRRDETTAKKASAIVDEITTESAAEFERSVAAEQAYRKNYEDSFDYNVTGSAQASWGWGSASISGGVSGSTNAVREEFGKTMTSAVDKHVQKASAHRKVSVEETVQTTTATGEELVVEREIENINVGRTLNFVFRQLCQVYTTVLSLTDVRVGFARTDLVNGEPRTTWREVTLPQLGALLDELIVPDKRDRVRNEIVTALGNVLDYEDKQQSFVEVMQLKDAAGAPIPGASYLRAKKDLRLQYKDVFGTNVTVEGIPIAGTRNVLRTDSVIVEALLGRGEALDDYSRRLQDEAALAERLANEDATVLLDRAKLGLEIVKTKNAEMAKLYEQIYEPNAEPSPAIHGNGQPE